VEDERLRRLDNTATSASSLITYAANPEDQQIEQLIELDDKLMLSSAMA
jgi:hypothetical protein